MEVADRQLDYLLAHDATATSYMNGIPWGSALGTPGADTDFFVDGTTGDHRPVKAFDEMSPDEQRAYNAWLNSDQVGDVIAADRTVAGQRMDEVIDSLEHR